ncbi:MAG: glycosyltransferase [Ignavibacteriales bacterium]|nr:glycosyltransferase [Ignavibacteriales bacterium]
MIQFKKPIVSIIIPTFNQLKYTEECIQSIYSRTTIPLELIVIINNKNDGTVEFLNQLSNTHNNIKHIINDENKGFPISVNQGISSASSEFVLILNNDVVVTNFWLETIVDIANRNELIGIVGPISNEVSGVQKDKEANYKTIDEMHLYAATVKEKNKKKCCNFRALRFYVHLLNEK